MNNCQSLIKSCWPKWLFFLSMLWINFSCDQINQGIETSPSNLADDRLIGRWKYIETLIVTRVGTYEYNSYHRNSDRLLNEDYELDRMNTVTDLKLKEINSYPKTHSYSDSEVSAISQNAEQEEKEDQMREEHKDSFMLPEGYIMHFALSVPYEDSPETFFEFFRDSTFRVECPKRPDLNETFRYSIIGDGKFVKFHSSNKPPLMEGWATTEIATMLFARDTLQLTTQDVSYPIIRTLVRVEKPGL